MEIEKFNFFCDCVHQSFLDVAMKAAELNFNRSEGGVPADSKKISVIVGIVGKNKGRILLEVDEATARKITEGMNGEPIHDQMELYLFLAEFTNMLSGGAVTKINNAYKGSELRLTPPAIFAGDQLEITTPHVQTAAFTYGGVGSALIDIGFEGV